MHSNTLVALRCITHVLPLSCKDKTILQWISGTRFHGRWNLDGWNDHIIQPARDSVLYYYQVCMPKFDYVVLALKIFLIELNLSPEICGAIRRRRVYSYQ